MGLLRARHLQQRTTPVAVQVLSCCFEADGSVVTCGEGHALFWKKEGQSLTKKKGVFGRKATAQTLLSCSRLEGKVCMNVYRCCARDRSVCQQKKPLEEAILLVFPFKSFFCLLACFIFSFS